MTTKTAKTVQNNPRPLWDLSQEVAPGLIRVTRKGKLLAYVLLASHYDAEDIGYMTDPSFWKMIEERRREPTIPLEEVKRKLEQRERAEAAGSRSISKNGKRGKRNAAA